MIYGEEKVFHMVRSVLPSKSRQKARWNKKRIQKKYRRRLNQHMHLCRKDPEIFDVVIPVKRMEWCVRDRRDADKLAHFEKWAIEITRHLPDPRSRLAFMKGRLPQGLIGNHAVGHLRVYEEFEIDEFRTESRYARRWVIPKEPEKNYPTILYNILCSPGGHRALNKYMVKKHENVRWPTGRSNIAGVMIFEVKGPTRPRLLRGIGDIDTFLVDLKKATKKPTVKVPEYTDREIHPSRYRWLFPKHTFVRETKRTTRTNPHFHPEWEKAMKEFVNSWKG